MSRSARFRPAAPLTSGLALLTAACADRTPTAPSRAATLALEASAAHDPGGKPIRIPPSGGLSSGTLPAGEGCSFPVDIQELANNVSVKIFPPDANGDFRVLVQGRLVLSLTNATTGKSITLNASGPVHVTVHADGSNVQEYLGRSVLWGATDPFAGLTLYLNTGRVVVRYTPGVGSVVVSRTGRQEDLCAVLG